MIISTLKKFIPSKPDVTQKTLTRRTGPVSLESIERHRKILSNFIHIYCHCNHGSEKGILCTACDDLLNYSVSRVSRCPYDPKPKCKECPTHCYKPIYREKIKEVMRFSGMYYVKRGRLDWMFYYFLRGA